MQLSVTDKQAPACSFFLPVILLADDDADDRNLFAEALGEIHETVELVMVKDGEQLMQYLASSTLPQVLFLDLNMPGKNGSRCLSEIKNNPLLSSLPVIILSTSINEAKSNQLIELGALRCYNKPSEFSELVSMLTKTMQLILYATPDPRNTIT
jgi:CheY-like chemotaxis protein